MSKRTLPQSTTPGALYVLAIAAGVLLSESVAVVLAILATVALLLTMAGTQMVQRHLPALGHLPLVEDHGFHVEADPPLRSPVESRQRPSAEANGPTKKFDAELRALLIAGRGIRDYSSTHGPVRAEEARQEQLLWLRDVVTALHRRDPAVAKQFETTLGGHRGRWEFLADYLGAEGNE